MNEHNIFMNDNMFSNTAPNLNLQNPNRLLFNQTLMMDLQQSQNSNFQNEMIKRALVQKSNLQNYPQNFRNPLQQQINVHQKFPPSQFHNLMENEKKWSITDNIIEKPDQFITHQAILENEKIKKKNYQSDRNVMNPKNYMGNSYDDNHSNEIGEEAQFSPMKLDNFEVLKKKNI